MGSPDAYTSVGHSRTEGDRDRRCRRNIIAGKKRSDHARRSSAKSDREPQRLQRNGRGHGEADDYRSKRELTEFFCQERREHDNRRLDAR